MVVVVVVLGVGGIGGGFLVVSKSYRETILYF